MNELWENHLERLRELATELAASQWGEINTRELSQHIWTELDALEGLAASSNAPPDQGSNSCGNCGYFQLLVRNSDGSVYGSCRLNPPPAQPMTKWRFAKSGTGAQQPLPQAVSIWPRVMGDDWCAQWHA